MGSVPPVLLLLLVTGLLLGKVEATCDAQCPSISVNVSTNHITVSGQVDGLVLQNITYTNGTAVVASDGSYNNTSLMTFVSGTQYIMLYGNSTNDCCYNFTTKPFNVTQLQAFDINSTAMNVSWNKPNEYQSSYSYKVQTSVPSSSTWISNTTVTNESATIENLTPGETYTFTVYTIANNSTESDPLSVTKCTVPGEAVNVTVNNYQSVNSLVVSWAAPIGNVSNYNVTITDINKTLQNTSTQVTFTDLSPGRNYTIAVQTISGSCNSSITTVTAATYPTPPRNITFITILANTTTLSWVEPVDMATVTKSYNITYYWSASSPITVRSNSSNAALSSLKSGSNYTITVVTVGVQEYLSTPVSRYVFTRPYPVNQPQYFDVNSTSVSLNWSAPNEYQTVYTYRVQTNVTSPSSIVNDIIVTNLSATIVNLTPGQTYTFLIYTRAADNVTESDPVSLTTCTDPGQAVNVTVYNYRSVNSLVVNWTTPNAGIPLNYTVTITGDVNETLQNTSTQVTLPSLLPGRNYNVTVQAISGSCKSPFTTVTAATYPTPPGNITFNTTANSIALSWVEPANMANLAKSYTITYGNAASSSSSSPTIWTQTSYTNNATLQNLTSGTNYTISVMTVGVRGYQSSPVTISVYTKPRPVSDLNFVIVTSNTVILSWSKPFEYQNTYRYRVQTIVTSSSTLRNNTMVNNESTTVSNLTLGETYTFFVYVRAADDVTESDPVSGTTCTGPGQVSITLNNYNSTNTMGVTWTTAEGKVDSYTITITGVVSKTTQTNSTQTNFTGLLPGTLYTVTVQTNRGNCSQTSMSVMEATYPTPPGSIAFPMIGTKNITLSWGDPVNMTGVVKSYNITYWNSSSSIIAGPVRSDITNVTLQNLMSGSNYTISVVTVGAQGYKSTSVIGSVCTKPLSVRLPKIVAKTTNSMSLTWTQPDEYQSSYKYRVQTNVNSSTLINDTIVSSASATIGNLKAGELYTFLIYTISDCNSTESDPTSITDCTLPGQASAITVNNYKSVDSLVVNWTAPAGKVSKYVVSITGDVNGTHETNSLSVTFLKLLPGRSYMITIQTFSGSCTNTAPPVTEATYPTPPQSLNFNSVGSDSITVSWEKPANMTGLAMPYNIIWNSTSIIGTVISNASTVTLQSLASGTKYTITVLTVGAREYQSTPVTGWIFTSPLEQPGSIKVVRATSGDAMNVTFQGFDTSNGPIVAYAVIVTTDLNANKSPEGVLAKTYNDFKNGITKTYVTSIIVQKLQRASRSSEISAYVGDGSKTHGYVNGPLVPTLQYRVSVAGFTQVTYDPKTDTVNEDQSTATITSFSGSTTATTTTQATYANATGTTSNTGTRHGQHVCSLPLSQFHLMIYVLCVFYSFIYR